MTLWGSMPFGRPFATLENSVGMSPLPVGHGFLGCGRFRCGPLADHWLTSDVLDKGVPFAWEPFVATEVFEESDDIDDDELLRARFLRGANMPRTSSGFMGVFPLIVPHDERDT